MLENVGVGFDTPVAIDLMEVAGTSNRRVSNMETEWFWRAFVATDDLVVMTGGRVVTDGLHKAERPARLHVDRASRVFGVSIRIGGASVA
jgi:hypothetical protein